MLLEIHNVTAANYAALVKLVDSKDNIPSEEPKNAVRIVQILTAESRESAGVEGGNPTSGLLTIRIKILETSFGLHVPTPRTVIDKVFDLLELFPR